MPFRRYPRWPLCLIAIASATVVGCAQSGPLLLKGTGVGTLKTSLSHMEYENQQLKREVASLKAEIRQTEDRLVQEESANGELSSKLDNAMAMLKRKGLDGGELAETDAADPERPRTTLPAGRSTRKPRKPPFARIPGRLDAMPSGSDADDEASNGWVTPGLFGDTESSQDRGASQVVWLPVARGTSAPSSSRR